MVDEIGPNDVRRAAGVCARALDPVLEKDWSTRAGDLEWDARYTLTHVSVALLGYALRLAARSPVQLPFQITGLISRATAGRPEPADLVAAMESAAAVLADVIAAAPPEARAFHITGMADPPGYAAMACDEMLIHTDDILRGFNLSFHPPDELAARILARLFPWAPTDVDPWTALRWANGREAIPPHHERLAPNWAWQGAPLSEWDGTRKTIGVR